MLLSHDAPSLLCCPWTAAQSLPGDFYLVRSRSGDFVVQVRQVLCSAFVTCNKAVRMRYGSSVVTFDVDYKYVLVTMPGLVGAALFGAIVRAYVMVHSWCCCPPCAHLSLCASAPAGALLYFFVFAMLGYHTCVCFVCIRAASPRIRCAYSPQPCRRPSACSVWGRLYPVGSSPSPMAPRYGFRSPISPSPLPSAFPTGCGRQYSCELV